MKKISHKYIAQGSFPINSIAFTVMINKITYGDYARGITPENKFRLLRGLVLSKHEIIKATERIQNNLLFL